MGKTEYPGREVEEQAAPVSSILKISREKIKSSFPVLVPPAVVRRIFRIFSNVFRQLSLKCFP
jgi:hypothetical protein